MMVLRLFGCVLLCLAVVFGAGSAAAGRLRWASDGDVNSMDPYARSETFLLTFLQNIYEPLVRRDAELRLEPALAAHWQQSSPTVWRFDLRPNVSFQDGTPFTAADVVFSYRRATSPASQLRSWFAGVVGVRATGPLTVEFETDVPNPTFVDGLTFWGIMSERWCAAHDAASLADLTRSEENFASRHANGTGPFVLAAREPDHRTLLVRNAAWWDTPRHNLTEAELLIIGNPTTRVAALLSGDVSMLYSVPPQALDMLARTPGVTLLQRPELRTVFLGFDQSRDILLHGEGTDRNPFRDRRVRIAVNEAIDIEAIHSRIMRGQSRPTGLLYGPGVRGFSPATDRRWPHDVEHARALMRDAGYPDGFGVTLDCPNDRYVNDEAICRAIGPMLARIGIRVTLNITPRLQHFARISGPRFDTSFFMLGWTPNNYDALNVLFNLAGSRDGQRGVFNDGGYANPAFDALLEQIRIEQDGETRDALIQQASALLHEDAAFAPLHQQTVVWAVRDGVEVQQSADDAFQLRLVRVNAP